MLAVATGAIKTTGYRDDRCAPSLRIRRSCYTRRRLFGAQGVPFRQAHDLVGKILKEPNASKKLWTELPLRGSCKKSLLRFDADF